MSKRKLKPGWKWVKFGDVVRLHTERCADPQAVGIERYVGLEHITPEDLHVRSWGQVAEGTTFTNRFRPGQVLFGKRRAYQRKVAVADFDGVCSGDIYIFEPADPAQLLPELLPFTCQTEGFYEHAVGTSAGSLSPRTNWTQLAQYEFALPPLEEQRRMVEVLQSLEETIVSSTALVSALDDLRKAHTLHSFSVLLNDESVRVVKVPEAGEIQMGRQLSPKYQRGISPRPYLRVANVFDGFLDLSDVNEMDFNDREFLQYRLQPGDVLLNEGNSRELVGRSSIFRGEILNCCFQNTLIRFRPKDTTAEFAQHYFRFCLYTGRFAAVAKQTTSIAHLGVNRLAEIDFPIPNRILEKRIVEELTQIEQALLEANERQRSANNLKRTLCMSLFSTVETRQ